MRRSFTRFTPASSIAWISGTRLEARSPTSSQGAGLAANQPVIGICSAAAFAAMKPRSDDRSIKIWDYQTKQCSGCLLPQVHRAVLGVLVPVYVQAALDATSIRHGDQRLGRQMLIMCAWQVHTDADRAHEQCILCHLAWHSSAIHHIFNSRSLPQGTSESHANS